MKDLQQKLIERVGIDRILHFAFGGWIACLWLICVIIYQLKKYSAVYVFDSHAWWIHMLLVSLIAGISKELIYDKWIKKSMFDWIDLLATFAGAVVSVILRFGVNI